MTAEGGVGILKRLLSGVGRAATPPGHALPAHLRRGEARVTFLQKEEGLT